MTTAQVSHPADAYERTGPLTVCPCCGTSIDRTEFDYACIPCRDRYMSRNNSEVESLDSEPNRAWFHARGVEERAKAKAEEPETWGVWLASPRYGSPRWCWLGEDKMTGTREEAERAMASFTRFPGSTYVVAPHRDGDPSPPDPKWLQAETPIKVSVSPEDTIPRTHPLDLAHLLFETDERVISIVREKFDLKPETPITQAQFDVAWENEEELRREWLTKARAVNRRIVEKGKKP